MHSSEMIYFEALKRQELWTDLSQVLMGMFYLIAQCQVEHSGAKQIAHAGLVNLIIFGAVILNCSRFIIKANACKDYKKAGFNMTGELTLKAAVTFLVYAICLFSILVPLVSAAAKPKKEYIALAGCLLYGICAFVILNTIRNWNTPSHGEKARLVTSAETSGGAIAPAVELFPGQETPQLKTEIAQSLLQYYFIMNFVPILMLLSLWLLWDKSTRAVSMTATIMGGVSQIAARTIFYTNLSTDVFRPRLEYGMQALASLLLLISAIGQKVFSEKDMPIASTLFFMGCGAAALAPLVSEHNSGQKFCQRFQRI